MRTIATLLPEEADYLLGWCKQQQLEREIFNGELTCRLKKWWGFEPEHYFGQNHVYPRTPIESDLLLRGYRDRFCPDADSILLYYYEVGGQIGEHSDKEYFDKTVTLINLVDAMGDLFGNRPTTRFRWNRTNYELQHGEVVTFDSRIIHSVPKLKAARYSLQFRRVADRK